MPTAEALGSQMWFECIIDCAENDSPISTRSKPRRNPMRPVYVALQLASVYW